MGERVVVNPAAAAEPPAEPAPAEPRRVVPLSYGQRESWSARLDHVLRGFDRALRALGGWRRLGFAVGVCFVSGGAAYGVADRFQAAEAGFWCAVGGLLIGLTVPVRGLDEPRPSSVT